MDPDDLKRAWRAQPTANAKPLREDPRRRRRRFITTIFRRDVREVGVCLLLAPLWVYLGIRGSLPWTWYLTVPALLWVAGYFLVDRMRHKRREPEPGAPVRRYVEDSLARVGHQIRLLRGVFRWYLLPLGLAFSAFFVQTTWRERGGGWWTALAASGVVAIVVPLFAGVYWLNQHVVDTDLEPWRRELEAVLASLEEEAPEASR